jgi:hypothetical protein
MIVGFTGTRKGVTEAQRVSVASLLVALHRRNPGAEFWHGDERESDTTAAIIAQELGYWTVAWPGPDPKTRGAHVSDEMQPLSPYLVRNRRIAENCTCLIATPQNGTELLRSGTWATVRYARHAGKTVYVVQPDGRIDREYQKQRPGSLVDRYIEHGIDPGRIR